MNGVSFREQAQALKKEDMQAGIIFPEVRSLRTLNWRTLGHNRFQTSADDENGLNVIRYHGWNFPNSKWRKNKFSQTTARLFRLYLEKFGKPDIIHARSVIWGGIAASELPERGSIPYVISEHSTGFARGLVQPWQEPLVRKAYEEAARVMAVSSPFARLLKPYAGNQKIEVVPNMVDTSFFTLPQTPRSTSPVRFLTVAFLQKKKALDNLLRSFAASFRGKEDVLLDIGGDGPERQNLENLCDVLKIRKQVNFLGLLSRQGVREAMWNANVFVLPSHVETFGIVFIEAMATGLPVIATRCGGPEDFVTDETGTLIEPGNVEALSEALNAYASPDRLAAFDANALRKYADENFSAAGSARRMITRYREVLS